MSEQKNTDKPAEAKTEKKGVNGYLLILAAFGLFWLGGHFRVPAPTEGKFLVAQDGIEQRFDKTVIFVLRHNLGGAYGVVINKQADTVGEGMGGPVEVDQTTAMYTTDVVLPNGSAVGNTGIAYVRGKDILDLEKVSPKPIWSRRYKGYAGWGRKQLDGEIRKGMWKVASYDEKLLFETPMDQKWDAAQDAALAQEAADADDKPEKKKDGKQTM